MTTATGPALAGWRVLLPRPEGRGAGLARLLIEQGAVPESVPLIAILPPEDLAPLDAAVAALSGGEMDWLVLASVPAVDAVRTRAAALGLQPPVGGRCRIAAVGPATAAAVRAAGLAVDLLPDVGSAAGLVHAWPAAPETGRGAVLIPQSEIAEPTLVTGIAARGWTVTAVTAYRTRPLPPSPSVSADLDSGGFAAVLLTSPSTVAALAGVRLSPATVIGVLGDSTARAATAAGLAVAFTAAAPTDHALVRGLLDVARSRTERKVTR